MVLNNLREITVVDDNGKPVKCRRFRTEIQIPGTDKIYLRLPVSGYDRLDLLSAGIYQFVRAQDLLLEFNSVPFFEWVADQQIIHVSSRIHEML
jgi:hypothetical protein